MKSTAYTRAQAVASFMAKLDIRGENECWPWKGCTYNCGYGSFKWRGKMRGANRVAWEIANGQDVPDGLDVLHTCDNRICCNPRHLWAGTHSDNMIDARKKLRHSKSALTPDQVREIRKLLAAGGLYQKDIGEKFGVSQGVICALKRGHTYQWVV